MSTARDDYPYWPAPSDRRFSAEGSWHWSRAMDEIDRLRAENVQWQDRLDALNAQWLERNANLRAELDAERTVRKQLAASRDAMVATMSFLASVIRCGEPFTPEVSAAVANFYTRWDTLLAASDALDKGGE